MFLTKNCEITDLSSDEIDCVSGGASTYGEISAAFGGFAAVAGGLGAVPTPASPALIAFAVIAGVISAAAGYAFAQSADGGSPADRKTGGKIPGKA